MPKGTATMDKVSKSDRYVIVGYPHDSRHEISLNADGWSVSDTGNLVIHHDSADVARFASGSWGRVVFGDAAWDGVRGA
jgi:hypothetical protein